ncbi:hypothetical protein [Rhodanobacter sp. 115]|uniref:hypothetical protein n=1 Tax=Rhodanobacter sp. FW021-MT20 TaxID=1162282 RepID=UPI00055A7C71|nr:hypothetical protein [Rhodanobacter sp. 115]
MQVNLALFCGGLRLIDQPGITRLRFRKIHDGAWCGHFPISTMLGLRGQGAPRLACVEIIQIRVIAKRSS